MAPPVKKPDEHEQRGGCNAGNCEDRPARHGCNFDVWRLSGWIGLGNRLREDAINSRRQLSRGEGEEMTITLHNHVATAETLPGARAMDSGWRNSTGSSSDAGDNFLQ